MIIGAIISNARDVPFQRASHNPMQKIYNQRRAKCQTNVSRFTGLTIRCSIPSIVIVKVLKILQIHPFLTMLRFRRIFFSIIYLIVF